MNAPAWTDTLLEAMRQRGDPVADHLVEQLFAQGRLTDVNELFRCIARSDAPVPPELPNEVEAFFEDTAALPPWADPVLLRRGEDVFGLYGPGVVMALMCKSLPTAYAFAKGSHVLEITGRLTNDVQRRILETAQLVFDVLAPGGLGPQGRGIRTLQKVRLIHGAIRHLVGAHPHWDPAWGVPVCQEDLAGTLMTFSSIVLDGLAQLGYRLSPAEEEGYFHVWRCCGYVLGIDPQLIPRNVSEGRALMQVIGRRQWRPSHGGTLLVDGLIQMLQGYYPSFLDGLPPTLVRFLSGPHIASVLNVQPYDWTENILRLQRAVVLLFGGLIRQEPVLLPRVLRWSNRRLLHAVATVERRGKRVQLRIPERLRQNWGLPGGGRP